MWVLVVEERRVVGNVLGSTGLFSLMLVALGAGGTRPGTEEKRRLQWTVRNLSMVQGEQLQVLTESKP